MAAKKKAMPAKKGKAMPKDMPKKGMKKGVAKKKLTKAKASF